MSGLDVTSLLSEEAVTAAPVDAPPALELRGVKAAYGKIEVLHGVDLAVPAGKVVALLGPNGAGKTTTLCVASGQMGPTAGEVYVAGRRVTGAAPSALASIGVCTVPEGRGVFRSLTVRENLRMATYRGVRLSDVEDKAYGIFPRLGARRDQLAGTMPEGRGIFPNLTVRENLRMVTYAGTSQKEVEERAFSQFPRLSERRSQLAGTMSGGEQQMLSLARALVTDPAVLLLDELSMGLAPIIVDELYQQVQRITRHGVSVLVVEQFARTVLGVADYAAIMLHGRITSVGQPDDIAPELEAAYMGAG
jgi:branched-chain amino acid transport system ATP-binding protein